MATQYREPEPEPKYWNKESQRVLRGAGWLCREPISLESLCGTYRWVFMEDDMVCNTEYRYESDPEVEKKRYPDYPGSFTLSSPSGEPTPENIAGSIRLRDLEGSFNGLQVYSGRDGEPVLNCWNIETVDWAPGFSSEQPEDGHCLEIYESLDDDGNNFIAFVWNQGWWGCSPHSSTCIAKKQKDGNTLVSLTDAERERLGMYLTETEVMERANETKEEGAADEGRIGVDSATGSKRKVDNEEKDSDTKRKREA